MTAAFEAEVAASVAAKTLEATNALAADPQPPTRSDAELLSKGPAAISRVTGMGTGVIVAPNGTRFELVPTASGTTVRFVSAGFGRTGTTTEHFPMQVSDTAIESSDRSTD